MVDGLSRSACGASVGSTSSLWTRRDREREAVRRLLGDAEAAGLLPKPVNVEFASKYQRWSTDFIRGS